MSLPVDASHVNKWQEFVAKILCVLRLIKIYFNTFQIKLITKRSLESKLSSKPTPYTIKSFGRYMMNKKSLLPATNCNKAFLCLNGK